MCQICEELPRGISAKEVAKLLPEVSDSHKQEVSILLQQEGMLEDVLLEVDINETNHCR